MTNRMQIAECKDSLESLCWRHGGIICLRAEIQILLERRRLMIQRDIERLRISDDNAY